MGKPGQLGELDDEALDALASDIDLEGRSGAEFARNTFERQLQILERNMPFIRNTDMSHPDELYKEVLNGVDNLYHYLMTLTRDNMATPEFVAGCVYRLLNNVVIPIAVAHCGIPKDEIGDIAIGVINNEYVSGGFVSKDVLEQLQSAGLDNFLQSQNGQPFLPRMYSLVRHLIDIKAYEITTKIGGKDPLTGLNNRRGGEVIFSRLVEEVKRANFSREKEESYRGMGVLVFDIDHFSDFNNRYNHAMGDQVLKVLTKLVVDTVRGVDVVVRWGGEEFVVILPNTDAGGTVQVAEKIRAVIEEKVATMTGELPPNEKVTITIGASHYGLSHTPSVLEGATREPDQLLMRAKEADRRNSVATSIVVD